MTVESRWLYLAQRVGALRDLLRDKKLDGYLLTNLSDLAYFTDYRTEGYYCLIGRVESWLLLPNLLFDQGKSSTYGFHCVKGPFFAALKKILGRNKLKNVGFDPDQLPYSFGQVLIKMGFKPVGGLVSRLRAVKDPIELERLRKANHLAWLGAQFVKKRLKPGRTERAISADLARFFNAKGHGIAFDLIVAGGANSAFPHHITSDYKLKAGEPVICDIGAIWEGYRSDLTRTFPLGKINSVFSKVYRIVDKAQKEAIFQLRPGVRVGSVDGVARRCIQEKGYGSSFVHSTGHGVGLDIHEFPRIGPGMKDKLKAGMVVTVEPGIYLPGQFGVRIEDTLLVTRHGSDILTR